MTGLHWFEYNGKDSRDFGLYIKDKSSFDKPERNIEFVSIPGRDGDLIIDNGGYKNVKLKYSLRLIVDKITGDDQADFAAAYQRAATFLQPVANYYKLKDSYMPDYYRKACLMSAISVKQLNPLVADFDVTFSCKPYMYALKGEDTITIESTRLYTSFNNPTNATSKPLIKVYALDDLSDNPNRVHKFKLNGVWYSVRNIVGHVFIDCETMNVYKGANSKNNDYLSMSFPSLVVGQNKARCGSLENTSIFDGNNVVPVKKIEIVPRWRTL